MDQGGWMANFMIMRQSALPDSFKVVVDDLMER